MGVCNCAMFCCTLLYVHSSIAIILMGKRELIALLNLSSWCLVVVGRLFLAVPRGCLRFVIVVFPDHTHLLFCQYQIRFNYDKISTNYLNAVWIVDTLFVAPIGCVSFVMPLFSNLVLMPFIVQQSSC